MQDDASFLRQVDADPGDLDTLRVYSDWLDDQGDSARAEFLRLQIELLGMRRRQKGFSQKCRRLLQLGQKFDRAWVAIVSRPRLVGTCWAGDDSLGSHYVWRYLPDGVTNYTSPSGTFQNGTWYQIGNYVSMETNRHYADYAGFVGGDWIHGRSHNITGLTWTWKIERTLDPEECDPGKPVMAVYDDHVPKEPKQPKKKRTKK